MVALSNPRVHTIGSHVYDYDSALRFLGRKKSRTLTGNTVVHWDGQGPIHVRYHRTNIITYLPSGQIILDTGGWKTKTTQERLNELMPGGFKIEGGFNTRRGDYSEKRPWKIRSPGGTRTDFFDGLIIQGDLPESTKERLHGLSRKMTRPDYPGHQPNPARIIYRAGAVKVYWDSALQEYEVVGSGEKRGDGYFTSDKEDALNTAETIARDTPQSNPRRHPGYKGANIQFPEDRFAYRGYSVLLGSDRQTWYISKDGFHIGSAQSAEEARTIIADLTRDSYHGES